MMKKISLISFIFFLGFFLGCSVTPDSDNSSSSVSSSSSSSSSSPVNHPRVKWVYDIGFDTNVRSCVNPILSQDEKILYGVYSMLSDDYETNYVLFSIKTTNGEEKWKRMLLTNEYDFYYASSPYCRQFTPLRGSTGVFVNDFLYFVLGRWVVKVNPDTGYSILYQYSKNKTRNADGLIRRGNYLYFTADARLNSSTDRAIGKIYRFDILNNSFISNDLCDGFSPIISLSDGRIIEIDYYYFNVFDENLNIITNIKYNGETNNWGREVYSAPSYSVVKINDNSILSFYIETIVKHNIDINNNYDYRIHFYKRWDNASCFTLVDNSSNYYVANCKVVIAGEKFEFRISKISRATAIQNEEFNNRFTENWADYPYYTNITIDDNMDQTYVWECKVGETPNDEPLSCPVLGADNKIYVVTQGGTLYCINGEDGTKEWDIPIGERVTANLVMDRKGILYIMTEKGRVWAIKTDSPGYGGIYPMYRKNPQRTD